MIGEIEEPSSCTVYGSPSSILGRVRLQNAPVAEVPVTLNEIILADWLIEKPVIAEFDSAVTG